MYLHIVDDTNQINHLILRTNDMFPGEHVFFVISKYKNLRNVNKTANVYHFFPLKDNIKTITKKLPDYKAVFIHNLCYTKARIVNLASKKTIFLWGMWGFDYYYVYPGLFRKVFLPYTKMVNIILFKYSLSWKYLIHFLQPLLNLVGIKSPNYIRQQAARKIDYSFNNMPEHSDVFQVFNIPLEKRFNLSYYSISYLTKGIIDSNFQLGKQILIGNSASNSSNHLDIFLQLRKLPLQNKKIVVPLSYGCYRYKKLVNIAGQYLFKQKFIPLTKFLSLSEYNSWLLSCNIMIFNHKRAQALGNIIFGVWAGHKIFLRKINPVYRYLKNIGVTVFSIEEELVKENLNALEKDKQILNRQVIETHYKEEKIRENFLNVINAINLRHERM